MVVKTTDAQPLPQHSGPALRRRGAEVLASSPVGKPGAEEWTLQQPLEDLRTGPGSAVNV